jgi:hypothetical protein
MKLAGHHLRRIRQPLDAVACATRSIDHRLEAGSQEAPMPAWRLVALHLA